MSIGFGCGAAGCCCWLHPAPATPAAPSPSASKTARRAVAARRVRACFLSRHEDIIQVPSQTLAVHPLRVAVVTTDVRIAPVRRIRAGVARGAVGGVDRLRRRVLVSAAGGEQNRPGDRAACHLASPANSML